MSYGDGEMAPNKWTAMQMLDCYRQASLCADATAYCQVVITGPSAQRGEVGLWSPHDLRADRWLTPCRRTNALYLAFDTHFPASATALIQAAAVCNGSQWCPNFEARAFRAVVGAEYYRGRAGCWHVLAGGDLIMLNPRYSLRSGFRRRRRPNWNVVGYTLRCQRNRVLYIGITNNPRAREAEHRLAGKRFNHLNIETRPMSRDYAEAWEARRLANYRDYVGRNPHYNRTNDGQYHEGQRPLRDSSAGARKTARPRQRDYGDGVSGVGWFLGLVVLLVGLLLVVSMMSGQAG